MSIYVGNLSFEATEQDLQSLFQEFGKVTSVAIIKDKFTGRSRGFAFVEMSTPAETQAAITGLNGKEFKGRMLTVNEARPREENRGERRFGGDNRGGGYGDNRGGGGYGGGGRGGYGGEHRGYGGAGGRSDRKRGFNDRREHRDRDSRRRSDRGGF